MSQKSMELWKNWDFIGVHTPEWAGEGHWIAADPGFPGRHASNEGEPPEEKHMESWMPLEHPEGRKNSKQLL
ncbi:MAG: hypothetical protein ACOYM2_08790 [Rectinemataceae bacterium]